MSSIRVAPLSDAHHDRFAQSFDSPPWTKAAFEFQCSERSESPERKEAGSGSLPDSSNSSSAAVRFALAAPDITKRCGLYVSLREACLGCFRSVSRIHQIRAEGTDARCIGYD